MVLTNFGGILRTATSAFLSRFVAKGIAAVGVVRTEIGPFPLKQITRYNFSWLCRRDIARIK